jgi:protein tyrosine phosphatase (PTP) superfamily phosphohydrolase (DUF442 family)
LPVEPIMPPDVAVTRIWANASTAAVLALIAAFAFTADALAADPVLQAPNVVPVSARLVTSGQPTEDALSRLAAMGFGAVIYLAPPTVQDAIPGEEDIVRKQGLEFVNIPIKFGSPTDADFRSFVEAMNGFRDRKVLVHCQVNFRASSMTFLYRVIIARENPQQAYESVARVWAPHDVWMEFLVSQLRKAGMDFEPY